jgi:ribonuclease D
VHGFERFHSGRTVKTYSVEKLAFSLRQTKATKIDLHNRSILNDHRLWKGRATPKNQQEIQEPGFSTQ